jgi:hypothetical protein
MGCNQSNTATVQENFPEQRQSNTFDFDETDETEIERRLQFIHEMNRTDERNGRPLNALFMSRSRSSEQFENNDGSNLRAAFNWGGGQPSITNEDFFRLRNETYPHESFGLSIMNNALSPSYFPPASPRAIRKLSTISMTPHHFCHEQNKECCICFQEFGVDVEVVRLPCGHMFHPKCIKQWLQQKCTCPVCRWELETSVSGFEHGRIARMKKRQIRLHSIDLEHMAIGELLGLAETHANDSSNSSLKKNEAFRLHLIDEIKKSSKVQVVEIEKPASELDVFTLVSDEEKKVNLELEVFHVN